MVSTAGLEPARVSPHAPQTCAYTDSATSTYIFNFQLPRIPPLSQKRYSIVFVRQSATSTYIFNFQQKLYYHKHNFCKILFIPSPWEREIKLVDEGDSACNVGEFTSRTVQDTRTGKPPLFLWNNRGDESKHLTFFVLKFADEGTRTPMSFLART